jgi:hypothetical protein
MCVFLSISVSCQFAAALSRPYRSFLLFIQCFIKSIERPAVLSSSIGMLNSVLCSCVVASTVHQRYHYQLQQQSKLVAAFVDDSVLLEHLLHSFSELSNHNGRSCVLFTDCQWKIYTDFVADNYFYN